MRRHTDGHVVIGPVPPDQLPDNAPPGALIRVDLHAWHSHSREAFESDLKAQLVAHTWESKVVNFYGAQLGQVAEQIKRIVDDTEPSLDGCATLKLEIGDLPRSSLETLARILDEARLAYRYSDGVLETSTSDQGRVQRILTDLRARATDSPEKPDLTGEDDGDPQEMVAYAALENLYEAVAAVKRHPDSMNAADHLANACTRCPITSPYGLTPALWHDLVAQAGSLAAESRDLDPQTFRDHADALYGRLRAIVA